MGTFMEYAVLFGRRLRAIRKSQGLKQRELADRVGKTPKYISQLETGAAQPSFDIVVSFTRELDVPMFSFFLFRRDENDPKILRRRIDAALNSSKVDFLKKVNRFISDIKEP
jgi:transcriptional regulator with XRE-family HTH domain